MPSHKQSFTSRPKPEPSRLSLADTQRGGDLAHCKSIFEQLRSLRQDGRTQVAIEPPNAIGFVSRNLVEFRLKRNGTVALDPIAKFLEMNFEPGSLFGRVIVWAS